MFKLKLNKNQKIDTLIGAGTRIDGDVGFTGGLHLDGHILGNIRSTAADEAVLSVGEQGRIDGSVNVPNVILNGCVSGDIDAAGRVELGAKARVLGNVTYTELESAVGAQINGKLVHKGDPRPATLIEHDVPSTLSP